MSRARPDANDGPGPLATRGSIRALIVIAALELVVNRVGLHALAPTEGQPPAWWYAWLDYAGLFLSYFTGTLAVALLGARAVTALLAGRGARDMIAQIATLAATALFGLEIVLDAPEWVLIPAEAMFGVAVIAIASNAFARGRDLGAQVGIVLLAAPLLLHTVGAFGVHFRWEDASSEPARAVASFGVMALALAAMVSPYCFAPRPFARAVAQPIPIVIAMTLAAGGAVAARLAYPHLVPIARDAIGVSLAADHPDGSLAVYLLAIATLAWTLTSCLIAPSLARRQIGAGLALLVLGGNAYRWPVHFLLPLVGLAIVGEAARFVRDEELADLPIASVTPPIADEVWAAYIAAVVAALERGFTGIHTLTTRGEGGLVSTMIVAEQTGLPVRVRIERFDGAVLALDVVVGREIDEVRGATFTLWAVPARALGINPAGPPAAPLCKTGDADVDTRFRLRGSAVAFHALFDERLRTRAAGLLAGWLAYWERDGLRYRVYPGRGSPLDLPVPLSELSTSRTASPDRLVALVETLAEVGARGIASMSAPTALTPPEPESEPEPDSEAS